MENTVFYLKINTNTDVAVACFNRWVEIVNELGAKYYILCDNSQLIERVKNEDNSGFFLSSYDYLKEYLYGVIFDCWVNVGAALLTPFAHAKANGFANFFNIDADDTFMCIDVRKAAEVLKKARDLSQNNKIDCLSLDMHSTILYNYNKHWSFGVTYVSSKLDFVNLIENYVTIIARNNPMGVELFDEENLDGLFTNLSLLKIINAGIYYVENMYFTHIPHSIHICSNGRFTIKKCVFNFKMHLPLNFSEDLFIPDFFYKVDVGLEERDSKRILEAYGILEQNIGNQLSSSRSINFRNEISKTNEVLRKQPNIEICLKIENERYRQFFKNLCSKIGFSLFAEVGEDIEVDFEASVDKFYILSTSPRLVYSWKSNLLQKGLIEHYNFCYDIDVVNILSKYILNQTRRYQGVYADKNRRCFILGGGDSITLSDIELLNKNGEVVMASNNFAKWFEKSTFRPDYYFLNDLSIIQRENLYKITTEPGIVVFSDFSIDTIRDVIVRYPDNWYYFMSDGRIELSDYPHNILFSSDIAIPYNAGTISYVMLQMAVNMGFKEIYFFGFDNDFSAYINHKGEIVTNCGDLNQNVKISTTAKDMYDSAFMYFESYCENIGVKVFNATRGGKFDVFKRVVFEELFK